MIWEAWGLGRLRNLDGLGIFTVLGVFFGHFLQEGPLEGWPQWGWGSSFSRSPKQTSPEETAAVTSGREALE